MSIARGKIVFVALIIFLLIFPVSTAGCTAVNDLVEKFTPEKKTTSDWSSELPPDFNLLVDAWKMVNKNYVDKDKLDPKKLSQGAVRGMVEALGDPHSAYVDPDLYKLQVSSLGGK